VVFVGRVLQGNVAVTDITAGTRMGVEHLLGRGHKRMGLLTVRSSTSAQMSRLTGWRLALHARGLPAHDEYHVSCNLSAAGAREAIVKLLKSSPRATAIFSDNLLLVKGILQELHRKNISCPPEIEAMSSDDAEWLDVFKPSISTVVQPSYQLGAAAAEFLLKHLQYPNRKFRKVLLQP
jgi:LacI family transcriptional regulator